MLVFAAGSQANTIPINPINITVSGGADVVAAPKSDLGTFGDANVLTWMNKDIINYNSLNSASLPGAISSGGAALSSSGTGGNSVTIDVTGLGYLFLHWGGQGGGWAQLFYIGSATGNFTFDNSNIANSQPLVGGLSFARDYGIVNHTVPDGGSTMLLLGMTLSGLTLVARRLKQ